MREQINQGIEDYNAEQVEKKYGPGDEASNRMKSYKSRMMDKLKESSPDGKYDEATIKKAMEEMEKENVTFHVAEHGLETSLDEVMSDDEWNDADNEDFAPNRNWYSVTVKSEADKKRWVDLKNEWLSCAWTPNQDMDERSENADRMREIEKEMRSLEV